MKELSQITLDTAQSKGASYADIRIIKLDTESIGVRNGRIVAMDHDESYGFGVRVLANGAWGFASSTRVNPSEISRISALAVEIAQASARLKKEDIKLTQEPVYKDKWQTPYLIDPFKVPMDEKLDILFKVDAILRKNRKIAVAISSMGFRKERQWLATSEGSFIEQLLLRSGAGYSATAVDKGESQIRSYPTSFGGQYMSLGYELINNLRLVENAARTRDEAVELLTAKPCPSGKTDLILGGAQLGLQIHESVGHPTELDRVFGAEESYAGRSFLTPEKYTGHFKYGSPIVNLVGDGTVPGGLATIGYDDDAVKAQRWHIVESGIFKGYQTNREFAGKVGDKASRACCRADGFNRIPMVRNNNISLMPGDWELDDLIADTKNGLYMETNRSWSIDQMRLNFQFGCEIGWVIKNGKKTHMVKNPTYQGITPEFWSSCDAICNENHWVLWGVPNCGKGEPSQTAEMSHGTSPTRFRNVTVGVK
ncbi:MAG: TldD/PmbA family protein [Planctomycetes bacterium]|nr:TldD/PmbA family protein [Planctomycetota bacterium]